HVPANPPQSLSVVQGAPVLIPPMQWLAGPALCVQSSGPVPGLGPSRTFVPAMPTTPNVTLEPSVTRAAGSAAFAPPPRYRQPEPSETIGPPTPFSSVP